MTKAVETAPKRIYAWRLAGRVDRKDLYSTDCKYLNTWPGTDADWFRSSCLDVDQRSSYFQFAYSSAPAMAMWSINQRSKHPTQHPKDKDGDWLDGRTSYVLHLPAGIPAKLSWAVTIYNPADGTCRKPTNQFDGVQEGADGSIDLYFGPAKPDAVTSSSLSGSTASVLSSVTKLGNQTMSSR